MSNPFDEIRHAVRSAEEQMRAVDNAATDMARLLSGRLSKVQSLYVLRALKRELQDFNAVTGEWKP